MDDAPHRQIPVTDRAALRFFAFWLANGTLIINCDDPVPDCEPPRPPDPPFAERETVLWT